MPAQSQTFWTTTVGDATPDLAAEIAIATVSSVSVNSYGANVRSKFMVVATPGADTTAVVFRVRRNSATGTVVAGPITYLVNPSEAYAFDVQGIAAEPTGVHNYVLTIVQTDTSVDSEIAAVVGTIEVGN